MTEPQPTAARDAKVRFLVTQRFGDLERFGDDLDREVAARKAEVADTSPNSALVRALVDRTAKRTPYEATLRLVAAYVLELEAISDEELDALFNRNETNVGLFSLMWRQMGEPPEQTFNTATFGTPDYGHWCRMPAWTVEEALSLSLGFEPGFLIKHTSAYATPSHSSPQDLAQKLAKRRDLLQRSIQYGRLEAPLTPDAFAEWVIRWDISVPAPLILSLRSHFPDLSAWDDHDQRHDPIDTLPERTTETPVGTRERDTFYKLIITLAVEAYRYDPTDKRSSVASDLHNDLIKYDLTLSVDTVREKLQSSASVLSKDVLDRISKAKR